MTYSQWNNAIASFFFAEEKGTDQQVLLFITKEDIVRLGTTMYPALTKDAIFQDFITSIKTASEGSTHPIDGTLKQYDLWTKAPNKETLYPFYIAYLALFILPLTETSERNYNANNYYDRVNDYLHKYGILDSTEGEKIGTSNFRLLDPLWTSLEEWSIMICNLRYGYFNITPFKNKNWKFVGKPLSQAIFSPKAINRLPVFFDDAGLMPGDEISDNTFRQKFLKYGKESLRIDDGLLNLVRSNTELGESILDIIRSVYNTWSGYVEINEENSRTSYTVAQLKLCMEYDASINSISLFYRAFSPNDYPEDLCFNNIFPCKHIYKGWSNELDIPFTEEITLEDKENKWRIRTAKKDIRILVPGSYYDFNEWVEIPEFTPNSDMLLLIKESSVSLVNEWLEKLECKFTELQARNVPKNCRLIRMCPPYMGLNGINGIAFRTTKKIIAEGGVKLSAKTYLSGFLPKFSIENGESDEELILTIDEKSHTISLTKNTTGIWELPENIPLDTPLRIKINPPSETDKGLIIRIGGYAKLATSIDENLLPKRDAFGKIISGNSIPAKYAIGSKAIGIPPNGQLVYDHLFRPINATGTLAPKPFDYSLLNNDALLNMLTAKGKSSSREYFEAFEIIYNENFSLAEIYKHPPLAMLKRWSLNLLDYMGFLDFEYSAKSIVINAPQFIRIPAPTGGKVLLIGGRTPSLVKSLEKSAKRFGVGIEIAAQDESLIPYLLPNSIVLTAFAQKHFEVEAKFKSIAKECDILFDTVAFPQYSLAEFSGGIEEYEASLIKDDFFLASGLSSKVFNAMTLRFEKAAEATIQKDFSLVEYRLNEYTYFHKLWKNGVSYPVDKNWGRYLVLRHEEKNVICIDYENKLTAIPSNVPLPRLIEESMTLFSGFAPKRKRIELNGYGVTYNVYENIPQIFAKNYFRKVGQQLIETKIVLS